MGNSYVKEILSHFTYKCNFNYRSWPTDPGIGKRKEKRECEPRLLMTASQFFILKPHINLQHGGGGISQQTPECVILSRIPDVHQTLQKGHPYVKVPLVHSGLNLGLN